MLEEMKAHPAAELFPMMSGSDFDALVEDIRENGQREPIITHENMILDGRNRYRACLQIGIEPETMDWTQVGTAEAFVISMNLHRRHLNESQRAAIAATLATRTPADTQVRFGSDRADYIQPARMSNEEAGALLNVSRSSVTAAKTVLRHGTPEEIADIRNGEATVNTIAREIRKGKSPEKRKSKRDEPLSQRGKNVERIQRAQMQAEIWARLSDALNGLTSLPLPADVAQIIRANTQRTRVVDEKLARSLNWLTDFHTEWSAK